MKSRLRGIQVLCLNGKNIRIILIRLVVKDDFRPTCWWYDGHSNSLVYTNFILTKLVTQSLWTIRPYEKLKI